MADDKHKIEKRVLVLSAHEIQLATVPERGAIVFRFDLAQTSESLVPELDVAIQISPTEARRLATALIQMADEIQGKPS